MELASSDAMAARDALPVLRGPLFLWRATPFPFLKEKRKWGRKTQADEYPQGAGRICNAPSSRTAALGIGPYIFYRRFSDFHTPQVQSKALVDGGAGEPFERFPCRLFPFLIGTERRPSTAVGFREGRRRLRIWSFRRPGGSGMEQASSDAAAVLFFLRKEKEKNGGAKNAGGLPPTCQFLCYLLCK